jgi:phosphatidylserine decarboxylase
MKLAEGGGTWIAGSILLTVGCFIVAWFVIPLRLPAGIVMMVFAVVTLVLIIFFRDPERNVGPGIVAPADGYIREISTGAEKELGAYVRLSIFMNIHDVHVNRMPLDGTITTVQHRPGGHIPAFKKESERNEQVCIMIDTGVGMVKVVQIAGTLARRIVPYVQPGDSVKKGERIGLIRLGSRVDLYLPGKLVKNVMVTVHDKVKAGVDTLAEINA